MSKFLKFIVNLFLICAILAAAAIFVPPLAGINTTIVDSQLMDTNLPMGSVTYSRPVYVTEISQGDKLLRQTDTSSYVYTVVSGDAAQGLFEVRDAYDPAAEIRTLQILNVIARVVITIPYIGYIVYAMHSIEGIIILALVVLLMIILFILSELWRKDPEDEDEEDDEEEEDGRRGRGYAIAEEPFDLQNAVDIRPYMDAQPAEDDRTVPTSDMEEESFELGYKRPVPVPVHVSSGRPAAEEAAIAKSIVAKADSDRPEIPAEPEPVKEEAGAAAEEPAAPVYSFLPQETPAEDRMSGEAEEEAPAAAVSDVFMTPQEAEAPEAENAETSAEVFAESVAEAAQEEETFAEETPAGEAPAEEIPVEETPEDADIIEKNGSKIDMDQLQKELEAVLNAEVKGEKAPQEAAPGEPAEEILAADEEIPAEAEEIAEAAEEIAEAAEETQEAVQAGAEAAAEETEEAIRKAADEITAVPEAAFAVSEAGGEALLEEVPEEELQDPSQDLFVPVERPSLEDILKAAERAGVSPEVIKDPVTGISVVDCSGIL